MNKKLITTIGIVILTLKSGLLFAAVEELRDQDRLEFFQKLRWTFNSNVQEECSRFTHLSNVRKKEWIEETHRAIREARDPSYLKDLHCLIMNKSQKFLSGVVQQGDQLEEDQNTYNLYSFLLVHSFHTLIFDKVKDLTKRAMRARLKEKVDFKNFPIHSFDYLKVSRKITKRVERSFSKKYIPHKLILSRMKAMRIYQDETLLDDVLQEVRKFYRYDYDKQFMTQVIFRIAERKVLLRFSRYIMSLYGIGYFRSDLLKVESPFDLFKEKVSNHVIFQMNKRWKRIDPNNELFLMELFALNRPQDHHIQQDIEKLSK